MSAEVGDRSEERSRPGSKPFAGAARVAVVLPWKAETPEEAAALAGWRALLQSEHAELEVELGAPVEFVARDPGEGPRFLIGPARANPDFARYPLESEEEPHVCFDPRRQLLVADAGDLDSIGEALTQLRTLVMTGGTRRVASDCRTLEDAVERIVAEVGWTYPAFGLRGLDWQEITARHRDAVLGSDDPLAAMQAWLAELADPHSWVKPRPGHVPLPYQLWVEPGRAIFARVPPGTAAHELGVRPGDELLDVDTADWWRRVGAARHMRPLMTGYRVLSGPVGVARELAARSPSGETRVWSEAPAIDPPFPLVHWTRLPSGAGYLRIEAWRADRDVDAAIDAAFGELCRDDRLIVDLRGNGGGNLVLAQSFRDRFLRERTVLGSIRFSTGPGELSESHPLVAEPAAASHRWPGRVRFLTDPLTYSASEDALLGLQGLLHVQVVGEPSGGGSGRPRALRLLPGQQLTVSTALTYDRTGRCLEGAGIPVDLPVTPNRFDPDAPDRVLQAAERGW